MLLIKSKKKLCEEDHSVSLNISIGLYPEKRWDHPRYLLSKKDLLNIIFYRRRCWSSQIRWSRPLWLRIGIHLTLTWPACFIVFYTWVWQDFLSICTKEFVIVESRLRRGWPNISLELFLIVHRVMQAKLDASNAGVTVMRVWRLNGFICLQICWIETIRLHFIISHLRLAYIARLLIYGHNNFYKLQLTDSLTLNFLNIPASCF